MPLSPRSLPAVRARLVAAVARAAGGVSSTDHALRCVPVRRNRREDDGDIAEWRATFEVGARQWSASGHDRDAALNALERAVESAIALQPPSRGSQ